MRKMALGIAAVGLLAGSSVHAKPPKLVKPPPEHILKVGGPKDTKAPKPEERRRVEEVEERVERGTSEKLTEKQREILDEELLIKRLEASISLFEQILEKEVNPAKIRYIKLKIFELKYEIHRKAPLYFYLRGEPEPDIIDEINRLRE